MKIYAKTNDGVILYRDGEVEGLENSPMGVFFTTDLEYLNNNQNLYNHSHTRAKRYLLLPQAKIWNPASEFEYYEAWSWDNIVCTTADLEKFGLYDECDYEIDEGYGVTSTTGLAEAGKRLGYDATLISDVCLFGPHYDEYAVYNPMVITPLS